MTPPRVARRPRPPVLAPSTAAAPPRVDPAKLVIQATDAFQRRRFDDAVRLGHQATEAGAGAPAHVVLGNVYLAMRKLPDAEQEYSHALSLDPDDGSTRERLAIVREMLKREMTSQP